MPYRRIRAVAGANVRGSAKAVLLALGIHADKTTFRTFASTDTLAYTAGVSRRTCQRALDDLEAAGWIRLHRSATQHRPAIFEVDVLRCEASMDKKDKRGSGVTVSPLDADLAPLAVTESPLTLLTVHQGGQSDTPGVPVRLPDESVKDWVHRAAEMRDYG